MSGTDLDRHLNGIIAGEPNAYAAWLSGAEPRIRLSLRSFAQHADTEALVQECLLRVWQVAPRFTPDGEPNALLRLGIRIARNLAVSELRKRRVPLGSLEDAPEPQTEPAPPDPLLRRVIKICREKLPRKPSAVLSARLGRPTEPDRDLAASMNMKLNTFLQNITRARKLLALCLEKAGVEAL